MRGASYFFVLGLPQNSGAAVRWKRAFCWAFLRFVRRVGRRLAGDITVWRIWTFWRGEPQAHPTIKNLFRPGKRRSYSGQTVLYRPRQPGAHPLGQEIGALAHFLKPAHVLMRDHPA